MSGNGAGSDGRSCISLDVANQAIQRVSYATSGMILGLRGGAMCYESRNTHTKNRKFFDIILGGDH